MSRSGNQYVYTVELNGKLLRVYKNRRNMNRWLRTEIDRHKEQQWALVQDECVRDVYLNMRARGVASAVYRNILLHFNRYGTSLRKQYLVKCWVIKSERIT